VFLVRNAVSLGGDTKRRYLGELFKKFFLINLLNFDLSTLLRELLEMLLPLKGLFGSSEFFYKK
jgi:hypothetical protein